MASIINGQLPGWVDNFTTLSLGGVHDSLGYRVGEIERHLHSYERWMELATAPAAETHRADAAGTGAGIFQIDAGTDTWGSWLQVLGSTDTPIVTGSAYFDLHGLVFVAAERNLPYVMQVAYGASGAAALTAGTYTEAIFVPAAGVLDKGPVVLHSRRHAAGTKVWARCLCPGQDTGTMNFFLGLHEYEG
jgi:hypothetical protein